MGYSIKHGLIGWAVSFVAIGAAATAGLSFADMEFWNPLAKSLEGSIFRINWCVLSLVGFTHGFDKKVLDKPSAP